MCGKLTATAEEILNAIKVERQRYPQSLVERVTGRRGYDVAGINGQHIHAETGADREIFPVALHFALMMIAGTQAEFVVVGVFRTDAPLYFLHLAFKTAFRVAETLENAGNGGHVVIIITNTFFIFFVAFVSTLQRLGGLRRS